MGLGRWSEHSADNNAEISKPQISRKDSHDAAEHGSKCPPPVGNGAA